VQRRWRVAHSIFGAQLIAVATTGTDIRIGATSDISDRPRVSPTLLKHSAAVDV
jgi:hypothetical protein